MSRGEAYLPVSFPNIITPEEHAANIEQISFYKRKLAEMEAKNDQGLKNHQRQFYQQQAQEAAFRLKQLDEGIVPPPPTIHYEPMPTATIEEIHSPDRFPPAQQNGNSAQWSYTNNPAFPSQQQYPSTPHTPAPNQRIVPPVPPQLTNPLPPNYPQHQVTVSHGPSNGNQLSYGISPFASSSGQQRRAELGVPSMTNAQQNSPIHAVSNGRPTPTGNGVMRGPTPSNGVASHLIPTSSNLPTPNDAPLLHRSDGIANGQTVRNGGQGGPPPAAHAGATTTVVKAPAHLTPASALNTALLQSQASSRSQTPTNAIASGSNPKLVTKAAGQAPGSSKSSTTQKTTAPSSSQFTVQKFKFDKVPQPSSSTVPPAASSASISTPVPSTSQHLPNLSQRWTRLQTLLNHWQKAVASEAVLDIPMTKLRVIKREGGFLYFFRTAGIVGQGVGEWISPSEVPQLVSLQGEVQIYVSRRTGSHVVLAKTLDPTIRSEYVVLTSQASKNAPEARYPTDPPQGTPRRQPSKPPLPPASLPRTPKEVPTTFLAHDLLRALGKTELYKADDEYVRFAKRRAIMSAGQGAPVPGPAQGQPIVSLPMAAPIPKHVIPGTAVFNPAAPTPRPLSTQNPYRPGQAPGSSSHIPNLPNRVPLFLPDDGGSISKSSSPLIPVLPSPPPSGRQNKAYVLIPPAPEWVTKFKAKQSAARKKGEGDDTESERELERVRKAKGKEKAVPKHPLLDLSTLKQNRSRGWYDHVQNDDEAAAMSRALDCLGEIPCRWYACESVLNSLGHLVAHVLNEHLEKLTCAWHNCAGKTFASSVDLAIHLESHVLRSIPCAYQDCNEIFRRPAQLTEHQRTHVREGRPLRPGTRPLRVFSSEPGVLPNQVPTWTFFLPLSGFATSISAERHAQVGPWVLRSICAPTSRLRIKQYSATQRMGTVLLPNYEYMHSSETDYSARTSQATRLRDKEFAPLPSKEMSVLIEEGKFVLWPTADQLAAKRELEEEELLRQRQEEEDDEDPKPSEDEEAVDQEQSLLAPPEAGPSGLLQDEVAAEAESEENASDATVLEESIGTETKMAAWGPMEEAEEETPRIEAIEEDDQSDSTEGHGVDEEDQVLDMLQDDE
ncbi:hypothetical protein MIND_00786000 [Mycena indigotica]|uniref:C2H2-type domain-containing protein n=1 Tax=Mycena indigotica TaxID=2126181 RepID=A0A8H6W449_9AGAR|nr:uncharacterized protein MIND_00786000 [Mycena indigotica]KAF7302191.1 hypothetical protein MIND_00786000 [Mycena indigotica]